MSYRRLFILSFISLLMFLPGCDAIIGIFKAGFWTAIILVVLIAILAIYGYKKFSSN